MGVVLEMWPLAGQMRGSDAEMAVWTERTVEMQGVEKRQGVPWSALQTPTRSSHSPCAGR